MLSWGFAGFLGGFIKGIKPQKSYWWFWLKSLLPLTAVVIASTLFFEIVMNVSWAIMFPFSILGLFISALPFIAVHLVSNIAFTSVLPFARKFAFEKGKFNEMEICKSIIGRFGSKHRSERL